MSVFTQTHSWNGAGTLPAADTYEERGAEGILYEVTAPTKTTVTLRNSASGATVGGTHIGLNDDRPHPFAWHKPYGVWDRPYGTIHGVRPTAVYKLDDGWAGGRFNIYSDGVAERVIFGSGRPVREAGFGKLVRS